MAQAYGHTLDPRSYERAVEWTNGRTRTHQHITNQTRMHTHSEGSTVPLPSSPVATIRTGNLNTCTMQIGLYKHNMYACYMSEVFFCVCVCLCTLLGRRFRVYFHFVNAGNGCLIRNVLFVYAHGEI